MSYIAHRYQPSAPAPDDTGCAVEDCGRPFANHAEYLIMGVSPAEAAARLDRINADIARDPQASVLPLGERLALFYRATGTAPADFEEDDDEEDNEDW